MIMYVKAADSDEPQEVWARLPYGMTIQIPLARINPFRLLPKDWKPVKYQYLHTLQACFT